MLQHRDPFTGTVHIIGVHHLWRLVIVIMPMGVTTAVGMRVTPGAVAVTVITCSIRVDDLRLTYKPVTTSMSDKAHLNRLQQHHTR